MKIGITCVLMMAICHGVFSQNKDIETITNLNRDWLNSYPTKDKGTLNRIFADDFVLISPKGTKMTKRDIIDNLDKQETLSINIDSVEVELLTDNVGVVTAYTTFVLKADNKEMTGKNCYQDVYVKRKGTWYAVKAHVTLLSLN